LALFTNVTILMAFAKIRLRAVASRGAHGAVVTDETKADHELTLGTSVVMMTVACVLAQTSSMIGTDIGVIAPQITTYVPLTQFSSMTFNTFTI